VGLQLVGIGDLKLALGKIEELPWAIQADVKRF
jgi:hypothetical protein